MEVAGKVYVLIASQLYIIYKTIQSLNTKKACNDLFIL